MGALEDLQAMLEAQRRSEMTHGRSSGSADRKATTWEDVGRAVSRYAPRQVGAFVDLANMAMLGAGGDTPVMGSKWLTQLGERAGVVAPAPESAGGQLIETVGDFTAPSSVATKAAAVTKPATWAALGGMIDKVREAPKIVNVGKVFKSGENKGILRGTEAFGGITPQMMTQMRKDYVIKAQKGGPYSKYWYDNTSQDLLNLTGRQTDVADRLVEPMAILSSTTPVGSNTMYGFKGWNQYAVGDRVHTGKYPGDMGAQVYQAIDEGANASGLKRSPYAGGLSVGWRPDANLMAVNDIHNIAAYGIIDPKTGKPWRRGAGDAQHRMLQEQQKKVVDELNKQAAAKLEQAQMSGALPGEIAQLDRPDWNKYRSQAGAWSTERNDKLGVPMEEAGKHYGDFVNDYSAQVPFEFAPGGNTGMYPEWQNLPLETQWKISNAFMSPFLGKNLTSRLTTDMGGLSGKTLANQGLYEGVKSPGYALQVPVGKETGSQDVDASSRKLLDAIAAGHSLFVPQKQVAWNFLGGKASKNDAGGVRVNTGESMTVPVLAKLQDELSKIGIDIAQVDPQGARALIFREPARDLAAAALENARLSGALQTEAPLLAKSAYNAEAAARKPIFKSAEKIAKQYGAKLEPRTRNTNLFPRDENWNAPETWSTAPFTDAIEAAGPQVVQGYNRGAQRVAQELQPVFDAISPQHSQAMPNLFGMPQPSVAVNLGIPEHKLSTPAYFAPLVKALQSGNAIDEIKRLRAAGIVPAAALSALGLGWMLGDSGSIQ